MRRLLSALLALGILAGCGCVAAWAWSYRWLRAGRSYIDRGIISAAQQSLFRFVRWHPAHPEANYLLGLSFGVRSDWSSALHHFQQVPDDCPEGVDSRWREGDVLIKLNRAADAESSLKHALELDPNCLEALRGLIHLYRWQDRQTDAAPLVWKAYEITEQEQRPMLMAEWFRFRFAQYNSAQTFGRLREFLATQPDDLDTAVALGRWSLRERQLGWARTMLEQAFQQQPGRTEARTLLAECWLDIGNGTEAEKLLVEWPETQRDVRYWRLAGRWQQEFAQEFESAIKSFQKSLASEPDDWQVRFRLADCLRMQNQSTAALREASEAERIRDITRYDNVREILDKTLQRLARIENRHAIGEFYRSIGYSREARVWFELALELDHEYEPSRRALEELKEHD